MKSKPKKHKDVCRVEQKKTETFGWYVRVFYLGKTYSKLFSDKKCCGKDEALQCAIEWRNATEQRLGKPRTDRNMVTVASTKSNTGVVGVRLNEKRNRYEVSWVNKDGKQGKTSVSIRKYGKTQAFKRACDIRQEQDTERLALSD